MSASPPLRVPSGAERLAERHLGTRKSSRWRIRGIAWGFLILFWVGIFAEPELDMLVGGVVLSLFVAGAAEVILWLAYRRRAREAAAELNREFPMGRARDEAVVVLRERAKGENGENESGRAARRLLGALYVPWEEPRAAAQPSPPPIAIEVAPAAVAAKPPRGSVPPPLPLQPEAVEREPEK